MALKNGPILVIDFETANLQANSACSLGLVAIENNKIIAKERYLIRTPSPLFLFTHIHGITWEKVKNAPTFETLWKSNLETWFQKASLLVAHNIGFDERVLRACGRHYGIEIPRLKTECTVKLSRYQLAIKPANLANVSQTLGIELNHHEALSDALASAYIYLHVKTGEKPWLESTTPQLELF